MAMPKKFDKQKMYKFGEGYYFNCYYRMNGASYEVGITYDDKVIFFGNFINKTEAMAWYKEMNQKMSFFVEEYQYMPNMKPTWYFNFAKNYFYNAYYTFLSRAFTKYNTGFKRAFTTDRKMYKKYETSFDYSA